MLKPRSVLLASVCLLPALLAPSPNCVARAQVAPAAVPAGGVIQAIDVSGNHRIDSSTITSYMVVQVGDRFDPQRINESLKTLYATGLFKTVNITRDGSTLNVNVVENPTVNQVLFAGNKTVEDKDAKAAISLKPRSVFTLQAVEADRQAILGLYAKKGHYNATVTPKIIELPDNRVNVVFNCTDGSETTVSQITFIGNNSFSQGTLKDVVSTRESAWWRFFSSSDEYSAERIQYDEYLLHKFYLHKGYADFQILSANANLSPDRKSFYLTYIVSEGPRYKVGSVTVTSNIRTLTSKELRGLVPLSAGDWFDGDALQEGVDALNKRALDLGYAFAQVNPQVHTDPTTKKIDITLNVVNGPHVYIQRIDITGNTRTEDKVIRRELTVAEGDAYNQSKIDDSTRHLKNLGFFKDEKFSTSPGTTQQQVVLNTQVTEQATGQFSLGGGYSSSLGALLNTGLSQNNFIGTGVNASVNAMIAQRGTQINLGVTDPYFLDRNLIAGVDIFRTVTDSYTGTGQSYSYAESSMGADVRLGYRFNDYVSQNFTYTFSRRDLYNIPTTSSANIYLQNEQGVTTLSQLSQTLSFDYVDDDQHPTSGLLLRLTTDFAGAGGSAKYVRFSPDVAYYIPLEHVFGNKAWVMKLSGTAGYLAEIEGYKTKIQDNFFLGGDNLRGFADGGVGPYAEPVTVGGVQKSYGGQIGGRYMWTASAEMHFPLPVSPDLGVSGFAFVDAGSLWGARAVQGYPLLDYSGPRVSAGVGVSWNTPFGLINLSLADPFIKKPGDQTQQFRISFGTQF
ncbi:outer membrane protein assembly factor BamA [Acidocella aromatica]|uniref:Outer membrane protein assembly factor BamA n=1 Tax=Acidocella aromatica TaxID=1303579 RepID=A0A840V8P4_9PROT|nr:outer membrane protein assembly factor BamA [Acidocella aromatica]MBB5372328.1 outer membrane protein insertion porin family [Acidocella aromatica]